MNNILCKCGHSRTIHVPIRRGSFVMYPTACMPKGMDSSMLDCPCYEYIADNLLTVEQMAKAKNLI